MALGALREGEALLSESERVDAPQRNSVGRIRTAVQRGTIQFELGEFRRATALFEEATALAWRLGADADLASATQFLAVILQAQGRHAEAVAAIDRAAPYYAAHPEAPDGGPRFEINRASVLFRAMAAGAVPADFAAVAALFEAAREKLAGQNDRVRLATVHLGLGALALRTGDLDAAGAAVAEMRRLDPSGKGVLEAEKRLLEGEIALARAQLGPAGAAFEAADEAARALAPGAASDFVWRARFGAGRVARKRGDLKAAARALHAAVDEVERLSRRTAVHNARATFFDERRALFEETIEVELAAGHPERALPVADAMGAAVLRSLAAEARVDALPAPVREAHRERLAAWLRAREAFEAEGGDGVLLSGAALGAWRAAREATRARLATELDAVYALVDEGLVIDSAPTLGVSAARPSGLPIDSAPTLGVSLPVLADDERLLSAVHVGGGIVLFELAAGRVSARAVTEASLLDVAAAAVAGAGHVFAVTADVPALAALSSRLDAGMDPSPTLSFVPWAGWLSRASAPTDGRPLVIADPQGNLPFARQEGALVAKLLGATSLVGRDADPAGLRARWHGARVFHFAGHGVLNAAEPWSAHLVLAGGARLSLADVLAERPAVGLAVLSGCETGATTSLGGRERVGLPEALLAGGTSVVLASVQRVDDAQTAELFSRFYGQGGDRRPADTLRSLRAVSPNAAAWRIWGRRALPLDNSKKGN